MRITILFLILSILALHPATGQSFKSIERSLGTEHTEWGDYDNDNDLDLLSGNLIYKNFTNVQANSFSLFPDYIEGSIYGNIDSGDYNNDSHLDILVTGVKEAGSQNSNLVTYIYHNNGDNTFSKSSQTFVAVTYGKGKFVDYDNDQDLDIFQIGCATENCSTKVTKLYRNDGGIYTDVNVLLPAYSEGDFDWEDYDGDNDLDLVVSAIHIERETKIYRNDGNNVFTDITANLFPIAADQVKWKDLDQDNDPDLIISGLNYLQAPIVKLYKNDNGAFLEVSNSFLKTYGGLIYMEDYDKDNDIDLLFTGITRTFPLKFETKVYKNNNDFTFSVDPIANVDSLNKVLGWFDYDHDGDHDIARTDRIYLKDGASGYIILPTQIPYYGSSSAFWKDLNKDGRYDLLISGSTFYNCYSGSIKLGVYINEGMLGSKDPDFRGHEPGYNYFKIGPANYKSYQARWCDLDNDGDLDVLFSGYIDFGVTNIVRIFRNMGNDVFTEINPGFIVNTDPDIDYLDFENDGDFDILISSYSGNTTMKCYENKGNMNFQLVSKGFSSSHSGNTIATFDYNNDGYKDVYWGTVLYKNNAGSFIWSPENPNSIAANGTPVHNSDSYVDYDNDGDFDLCTDAKIHKNTNGKFTIVNHDLVPVTYQSTSWADYDNDGDPDLLMAGDKATTDRYTQLYRNDGNDIFTKVSQPNFYQFMRGSASWADYNNDGNLDVILTGFGEYIKPSACHFSQLFENDLNIPRATPNSPSGLSSLVNGTQVTLSWNPVENEGIKQTYNVYIGTQPFGNQKFSSHSNNLTGFRKIITPGNAGLATSVTFKNFTSNTYYWSVQAIDNNYQSSVFGPEQIFTVGNATSVIPTHPFKNLLVYPNPAKGKFSVRFDQSSSSEIYFRLFSPEGLLLREEACINPGNSIEHFFDVKEYKQSILFLHISSEEGSEMVKIINL